jgi:hypothetical protein
MLSPGRTNGVVTLCSARTEWVGDQAPLVTSVEFDPDYSNFLLDKLGNNNMDWSAFSELSAIWPLRERTWEQQSKQTSMTVIDGLEVVI